MESKLLKNTDTLSFLPSRLSDQLTKETTKENISSLQFSHFLKIKIEETKKKNKN